MLKFFSILISNIRTLGKMLEMLYPVQSLIEKFFLIILGGLFEIPVKINFFLWICNDNDL